MQNSSQGVHFTVLGKNSLEFSLVSNQVIGAKVRHKKTNGVDIVAAKVFFITDGSCLIYYIVEDQPVIQRPSLAKIFVTVNVSKCTQESTKALVQTRLRSFGLFCAVSWFCISFFSITPCNPYYYIIFISYFPHHASLKLIMYINQNNLRVFIKSF